MEIEVNPRYRVLQHLKDPDPYGWTIWGCSDCGAVVFDQSPHNFYHDELTEATATAFNADQKAGIWNDPL